MDARQVGSKFNESVTADTDIFSSELTLSRTPSVCYVHVCMQTAGVFKIQKTKNSATVTESFFGGASLAANCLYVFPFIVEDGATINFQYSASATCSSLVVIEQMSDA